MGLAELPLLLAVLVGVDETVVDDDSAGLLVVGAAAVDVLVTGVDAATVLVGGV